MPRQILIWSCCLLLVQLASALTGDNVCKRIETSTEKIDYVVTEPVTYRLYTWCLKVPPRCSKYTTVMKERIKTKLQINNHTIDFCCDGYVQLETYCVPECNPTECPHLLCDSEKKCTCEAGFHGQRCHRECRPGFWGENCNSKCVCNGQPCNIKSGDCDQTTSTTQSTTISDSHFLIPNNRNTENNKFNKEISSNIPSSKNPLHNNYNTKKEKTDSSQDIIQLQQELLNQEATVIPSGISLEDMQTTLLPEDEVMIVYPSMKSKPTTELINPTLKKTTTTITKHVPTFMTTKKPILKYIPTESTSILKPNYNTEKYNNKKLSTIDYISIKHELNMNKNNKYNSNILSTTTESGKLTDENEKNKQHINLMNTVPKKNTNGLPPPVPDGSDNTINLKSNGKKNLTLFDNYENNNNNGIIKSNEIQRDMEEIINNNNNYSRSTNTDTTVNSSLVKAKWSSAFDAIDFSSLSIGISITVLTIIFLMLIVVMSTCLKKNKNDNTTSYYDNNTKTCHDNGIPCNGHYASPSGQPIFFCPAFTNSYAFELAQELRDTHYDHPRSVRCLSNEPVYAELQY